MGMDNPMIHCRDVSSAACVIPSHETQHIIGTVRDNNTTDRGTVEPQAFDIENQANELNDTTMNNTQSPDRSTHNHCCQPISGSGCFEGCMAYMLLMIIFCIMAAIGWYIVDGFELI